MQTTTTQAVCPLPEKSLLEPVTPAAEIQSPPGSCYDDQADLFATPTIVKSTPVHCKSETKVLPSLMGP